MKLKYFKVFKIVYAIGLIFSTLHFLILYLMDYNLSLSNYENQKLVGLSVAFTTLAILLFIYGKKYNNKNLLLVILILIPIVSLLCIILWNYFATTSFYANEPVFLIITIKLLCISSPFLFFLFD